MKNSLNLSKYRNAMLSFMRFVDDDIDAKEFLRVELYNGTKWANIFKWTNGNGDDNMWHTETYDLSGYLSDNFNLRLTSKESTADEETEIDDVMIRGILK